MKKTYATLKDWMVAFESAALLLLRDRGVAHGEDGYEFSAGPCDEHGPGCACVVYGMLKGHYPWARHDPGHLAEQLLGTMLPPEEDPP
jgi:hypothetical protein